jgi:hypothetical protein
MTTENVLIYPRRINAIICVLILCTIMEVDIQILKFQMVLG